MYAYLLTGLNGVGLQKQAAPKWVREYIKALAAVGGDVNKLSEDWQRFFRNHKPNPRQLSDEVLGVGFTRKVHHASPRTDPSGELVPQVIKVPRDPIGPSRYYPYLRDTYDHTFYTLAEMVGGPGKVFPHTRILHTTGYGHPSIILQDRVPISTLRTRPSLDTLDRTYEQIVKSLPEMLRPSLLPGGRIVIHHPRLNYKPYNLRGLYKWILSSNGGLPVMASGRLSPYYGVSLPPRLPASGSLSPYYGVSLPPRLPLKKPMPPDWKALGITVK